MPETIAWKLTQPETEKYHAQWSAVGVEATIYKINKLEYSAYHNGEFLGYAPNLNKAKRLCHDAWMRSYGHKTAVGQ